MIWWRTSNNAWSSWQAAWIDLRISTGKGRLTSTDCSAFLSVSFSRSVALAKAVMSRVRPLLGCLYQLIGLFFSPPLHAFHDECVDLSLCLQSSMRIHIPYDRWKQAGNSLFVLSCFVFAQAAQSLRCKSDSTMCTMDVAADGVASSVFGERNVKLCLPKSCTNDNQLTKMTSVIYTAACFPSCVLTNQFKNLKLDESLLGKLQSWVSGSLQKTGCPLSGTFLRCTSGGTGMWPQY